MNTRDLEYFVAIADLGQLHRAARKVGRSQPALSKCIHRLEDELGAKLFEREGRAIRLTAVGEALLASSRGILRTMQEAVREIEELTVGEAGHIRIGSGPTTAEWLLPGLFSRLLALSPALTFKVTTGVGSMLRQSLRDGNLDVVIGPLLGQDKTDFSWFAIATDIMVVAARADHPVFSKRARIKDLTQYGWLLPDAGVRSTQWLNLAFQARELPSPLIQIEAETVLPLRSVLSKTDLLTFVSRRDLGFSGGGALREVKIPGLSHRRDLGVLWRRQRYLPPAASRLIEILREAGEVILESGGKNDREPARTAH